jgi:hypothetical protein
MMGEYYMAALTKIQLSSDEFTVRLAEIMQEFRSIPSPWGYKIFSPPKFKQNREVSAKRARTLRQRGEYVHFIRRTVNGKARFLWGGPVPNIFVFRSCKMQEWGNNEIQN